MKYRSIENRIDYFPPLVGNGSLCINVGYNGTMTTEEKNVEDSVFPDNYIWWAGRRYFDSSDRKLVPYGFFTEIFDEPICWEQELDTQKGIVTSVCEYPDGTITSKNYIHHEHNIISLKKTFNIDTEKEYSFIYKLCTKNSEPLERFEIHNIENDCGFIIDYTVDGYNCYNGRIAVFADRKLSYVNEKNNFILKSRVKKGETICFYIIMEDDFKRADYVEYIDSLKNKILQEGYEKITLIHTDKWNEYMSEGYAEFDDKKLTQAYKTAQYAIKSQTTQWSIPVGLNNAYWNSHYFAFDEYFSYYALLTSNHKALAKRVPEFRHKGLNIAVARATYVTDVQARYPWETLEDGTEAAPIGAWMDHIFHMSHIIFGVFEYYKYAGDLDFLREKYEVMKACASFFLMNMVYKIEGGKTIIGNCTDLERLGASNSNAYMTTCSVIKALKYVNEATSVLGEDNEFGQRCIETAKDLMRSLPIHEDRYEPYPGCVQKSIAVFTGSFPYRVIEQDNQYQKNAMWDYVENEAGYGNCYTTGNGVSAWYAGIKAAAYSNIGDEDNSYKSLMQAIANCGCFEECFEINEKETALYRPWFTTAAGTVISAVNSMLVRCEDNKVFILPSFGNKVNDVEFKLSIEGGAVLHAVIKNKKLLVLNIECDRGCEYEFVLHKEIEDLTGLCK